MTGSDPKDHLRHYLQVARDVLLWKLDGLSEYDVRRPLTPTGTNLLGLVKHVASVEFGYFGDTFGRPSDEPLPWYAADAEPNADMWAAADETREQIVGLYRRAWAHTDATIDALPLDAAGQVPHWPDERADVTLHQILIHVISETHRHAGHADVVRELIDGTVGPGWTTTTWPTATRPGGRATGSDWRVPPGPRERADPAAPPAVIVGWVRKPTGDHERWPTGLRAGRGRAGTPARRTGSPPPGRSPRPAAGSPPRSGSGRRR